MSASLDLEHPEGVESVLTVLEENECPYQLRNFEQPAHHASQAAALLGCELGAVIKSLVFSSLDQDDLVLVLVSGKNRVDIQVLSKVLGRQVKPAQPRVVARQTGYPVGAVPPFGFENNFPVVIDEDLIRYPYLWASAGARNALVGLESKALLQLTQGRVCVIH